MDSSPTAPTIQVFANAATPGSSVIPTGSSAPETSYERLTQELWGAVRGKLQETQAEIIVRNEAIANVDAYVYGRKLETSLDIPIGHDFTPINWLKRVVEIHKTQFMGRPFQIISTYSIKDIDSASVMEPAAYQQGQLASLGDDKKRLEIENKKQKATAELRMRTIKDIIRDNGGHAMFMEGAESGGVAGSFILKCYYDEDAKKFVISPVETVENCYAVWSKDDFRQHDLFGYAHQISKQEAIDDYNVPNNVPTSPLGSPLDVISTTVSRPTIESQPMVTILETTGKVPGYCSKNGRVSKCEPGDENEINLLFAGNVLKRTIDKPKRLPKYYIFPNKKARRRAWGLSDITDAAINLNLTYIETLSDWRTVASKVNFPKFKLLNFGAGAQMPKFKSRTIQSIPMGEGQDIANLPMGDAGAIDFRAQLAEIKTQFSRETATAEILLDNDGQNSPSNSNQALITSMKPTTDVAEGKKELWSPVLAQMFEDALETLAEYDPATYGDLADQSDPWHLRTQWPSMIQKEDPIYQQMLLNRWNSGTMSLQTFLEAENESTEEIDRIKDEMSDITTGAIHAKMLNMLFSLNFLPAPAMAPPKVNVNLRGDLDPGQVGDVAFSHGFNGGPNDPNAPFATSAGPVGNYGQRANDATENQGLITGGKPQAQGIMKGPNGQPIATPANNQPGSQPMSQPGSGATGASPQGALNQATQQNGG